MQWKNCDAQFIFLLQTKGFWKFLEFYGGQKKCFGEQRKTDGGDVVPCSLDILVGLCGGLLADCWRIFGGLFDNYWYCTGVCVCVCVTIEIHLYIAIMPVWVTMKAVWTCIYTFI